MLESVLTKELFLMLLPLIAIQVGLAVYCAAKIFREGVENLNRWAWLAICLFVNLLGPIIFLLVGRKKDV
jgi:hypothetical protein